MKERDPDGGCTIVLKIFRVLLLTVGPYERVERRQFFLHPVQNTTDISSDRTSAQQSRKHLHRGCVANSASTRSRPARTLFEFEAISELGYPPHTTPRGEHRLIENVPERLRGVQLNRHPRIVLREMSSIRTDLIRVLMRCHVCS